jgi:carnitine O-acetyltransferase
MHCHLSLSMFRNSYIEDFWYDAYLDYEEAVVLNVNPFFVLEDDPTPDRNNQVARATSLIVSSLRFIQNLRQEILEPDVLRNTPLCMSQFQRMFGSTRRALNGHDMIMTASDSRHILVIAKGQHYFFEVFNEDGSLAVDEKIVMTNLMQILQDSSKQSPHERSSKALGILTAEDRPVWANLRTVLEGEEQNKQNLEVIDSALFCLCLDDYSPNTR